MTTKKELEDQLKASEHAKNQLVKSISWLEDKLSLQKEKNSVIQKELDHTTKIMRSLAKKVSSVRDIVGKGNF